VVRHISAAIDLVQFNSALCKQIIAGQHIGAMGIAPKREHRRMLQQKQRIAYEILLASGDDLLLDSESFAVGKPAESDKVDVHRQ
jgi:hypothetical protein